MPIYEFVCRSCGHNFEKLCKMSTKPEEVVCPACDTEGVTRKISNFACPGSSVGGNASAAGCGTCATHNCSSCGH